jgi:hypothetical protein
MPPHQRDVIVATGMPLARSGSRPYLRGSAHIRPLWSPFGSNARFGESAGVSLAQPVLTPHDLPAADRSGVRPVAIAGGALGAAVLLATLALWSYYGTAVFFEMIATGFAACF